MAKKKTRRRSGKRRTAAQRRATAKMIAANRRKARKNPSRKRRKAPQKRRTYAKRRTTRKNPSRKRRTYAKRRTTRKNPRRRKSGGGGSRKVKASLKNFLPSMRELRTVGGNVVGMGVGYMGSEALLKAIHGGSAERLTKFFEKVGIPSGSVGMRVAWKVSRVFTAFAVAGIAGVTLGKKYRDLALQGGLFGVLEATVSDFAPAEVKSYLTVGDYITTRALPGQRYAGQRPQLYGNPRAMGDYITRRTMQRARA